MAIANSESYFEESYQLAKKIIAKEIDIRSAINFLHVEFGQNLIQAEYIIDLAVATLKFDENLYGKYAINYNFNKYILDKIEDEFSASELHFAVKSMRSHVDYWTKTTPKSKMKETKDLIEEYEKRFVNFSVHDATVKYQNSLDFNKKFQSTVSTSAQQTADERAINSSEFPKKPKRVLTTVWAFVRNPNVVVDVLIRANGRCEVCESDGPFVKKSDDALYLEVHHKIPLAEDGDDTVENAIALCPNCHREAHHGVNWEKFRK